MSGPPVLGARHGYFIVQARAETVGATLQLTGVLENLTTGGKWRFATAKELAELLSQWGQLAAPAAP